MKVKQKEEEVLAPSMVSSFFFPPSAARSSPQASHQKNIEKMNVEKENLILSANKTSELIAAELEAISKLAESSIQIQQNTSPSLEDPHLESRTSYALSLYGRISNISWDYTAPSGRLAGCESSPPPSSLLSHAPPSGYANEITKEMYNFNFDLNELSSFELTNALWEMIGESMPEIGGGV